MNKNFFKKSFQDLFSSHWFKSEENNQISLKIFIKIFILILLLFILFSLIFFIEIYIPLKPFSNEKVIFVVEKNWGDEEIGDRLKKEGIIRSTYFFRLYTLLSLKHHLLKAGKYVLSTNMSIHQIVNKMVKGEVIREKLVILEGWTIKNIAEYLENKQLCKKEEFLSLVQKDYSDKFSFLEDKPKDVNLEGYLFPDTYEISENESCQDFLEKMLLNFDKKLTPFLREEILNQGKTIFDIVRMASMIEKEVRIPEERRIVSGILWKRLKANMPLQVDATINYITGKKNPSASLKDIQIDSKYNTYKYPGLPRGPICNPGLDSILAAIYPKESDYWYYLSVGGRTFFSKTLNEHLLLKEKYLK